MHRHRVLLIEDDDVSRDALVSALEFEGCRVNAAPDAHDALDRLRDGFSPCAILLDIGLPRKNGWQFRLEQVMDSALARIPVIVCSGDPEGPRNARLFGVPFVAKPIDLRCLLDRLTESCRHVAREA